MASSNKHEFVILGGHFSGLSVAHYLLRHTIPFLSKLDSSITYHVTIVTPNTHFYWKVGVPRAMVGPDLIPLSDMFVPIADGFKEYSSDRYSFVQGSAVGLEPEKKTVNVELVSGGTRTMNYSTLIVATGTTASTALWSIIGSHENSINALKEMHKALPSAKTILIAGGGPAGTETCGEIASHFPKAKIAHLSGSSRLLERLLPSTSKDAESRLVKLGVEVVHNIRVTASTKKQDGTTELKLSDGSTRTVDVFIESTGGKLNTGFLPPSWLNQKGQLLTNDKTLRPTAPGTEGVYAAGDAGSYSSGGILDIKNSVVPLCSTIAIDLAAKISSGKSAQPKQQEFKPWKDTQIVPIGPKGGVGQLFGWRIPSLMVWGIKGRTYMIDQMPGFVKGADFIKA
ncbi:hypothetical protein MMC30_008736 [Trapelia coarctata]|nr:hypothetical protein [Trapelia coarctata]